jgi:hypothetical protein
MTEETQQTQNYHQLKSRNEELNSKLEKLNKKKNELEDKLKKTNEQYQKKTIEFMKISKDIEKRNEELQDIFINENPGDPRGKGSSLINREEIQQMCKKTLDEFLITTENNFDTLKIEIVFGNSTLTRTLEKENYTFGNLKEDVMSDLYREINEFYFADANKAIYMDDMPIKKALFPLDKVNVVGIIPRIYVKDNFKDIDFNEIQLENLDKNNNEESNSRKNVKLTYFQEFKRKFYSNWIIYSKILFNTIFIIFYIIEMYDLRDLNSEYNIYETYSKNFFVTTLSDETNLLRNFRDEFVRVFQYPLEDQSSIYSHSHRTCKIYFDKLL